MLEAGEPIGRIATELGLAPATVSYHARNLGFPRKPRSRYDWAAIQAYYDDGHTYAETKARFGFSNGAWGKAVEAARSCRGATSRRWTRGWSRAAASTAST